TTYAAVIRRGFFAGQPGAPRGDTTGTVGTGSAEARQGAHRLHDVAGDVEVGGAASRTLAIGQGHIVVNASGVDQRTGTGFMVSHQHDFRAMLAATHLDDAHAVMRRGYRLTVFHQVTRP